MNDTLSQICTAAGEITVEVGMITRQIDRHEVCGTLPNVEQLRTWSTTLTAALSEAAEIISTCHDPCL